MKMINKIGLTSVWKKHGETIVLVVLLLIFFGNSFFIALNLKTGILPDEVAHFRFSKHFSSILGIPADTYETYSLGWYIQQNPFLYYWINGRIINLINLIYPHASDRQVLVTLRVFNVLFAVGTVFFCYLLSKEVIKKRWWRLVPVFFLTNTLMFVFLSGGVNYDNLANLFSMAGLLFLVRVLNQKEIINNSLLWIISIAFGCLVKYTILPLALAMIVIWLIFLIKSKPTIHKPMFFNVKSISLTIVLLILVYANLAIYGVNLLQYQSLLPPCREILLESQCQVSPYERRYEETALERKMTIRESIELGYPNPILYAGNTWIRVMILRTFGIAGHLSFYPDHLVNYYRFMIYGMIVITLIFSTKYSFTTYSLLGIAMFYSAILLYQNYNSELVYGFLHIAFQGRYIFPVIGAIYTIFSSVLLATKSKYLQFSLLGFSILLFLIGGPTLTFILFSSHFADWFIL